MHDLSSLTSPSNTFITIKAILNIVNQPLYTTTKKNTETSHRKQWSSSISYIFDPVEINFSKNMLKGQQGYRFIGAVYSYKEIIVKAQMYSEVD